MAKNNQSRYLYCFVDSKSVVHTADSLEPEKVVNSRLTAKDFISRLSKDKTHTAYDRYALNCHFTQRELIFQFNSFRSRGFVKSVVVDAPWQGVASAAYKRVDCAFDLMIKNRRPASLGGYHELNSADIFALSAADQIDKASDKEQVLKTIAKLSLPHHPVYRHAMFIEEINTAPLVALIANVIDPRFVTVLGLGDDPYDAAVVINMNSPDSGITHDLISSIWNNKPKNKNSKRAFLWQMYQEYKTGASQIKFDKLNDRDKNLVVKINNTFLSYLFGGWTSKVSITHRDKLFVPEVFFNGDYSEIADLYTNFISIKTN